MIKNLILLVLLCLAEFTYCQFPPIDTYYFPLNKCVEIETWEFKIDERTKQYSDSTLINLRRYDKNHNLIEYKSYVNRDTTNYDSETYIYNTYNKLTNITYTFAERNSNCAFRTTLPYKKIEIANEKGQLKELIKIENKEDSEKKDSLMYKFEYDENDLLILVRQYYLKYHDADFMLKYKFYD